MVTLLGKQWTKTSLGQCQITTPLFAHGQRSTIITLRTYSREEKVLQKNEKSRLEMSFAWDVS